VRIHITGNAGSGKSTLAQHIGHALDLPVRGLDNIVWMPRWEKTPDDQRQVLEDALVSEPRWVIEGVSPTVRSHADVVIFLDVRRLTSYYRCAKRNWRYWLRSRPGLPPECPEILIVPYLVRLIWRFPHRVKPQILSDMQQTKAKFFHVSNDRELAVALGSLGIHS